MREYPQREILKGVLADITERVQTRGMKTYGRPMTTEDGRDGLQDLYEELLDACCYIKKVLMEKEARAKPYSAAVDGLRGAFREHESIPVHESGCVS